MRDITFVLSSLKSRWLNSLLSVLLTAFGVMLALLIIQFGHHIQNRVGADGKGIDIVVGAKGSPLQIILSSVYHIDIPTGNIPYAEAQKWMNHPQVRNAIPLALGDNWHGTRIVGTTPDYIAHYNGVVSSGRVWDKPFEAVVGADVSLNINDEFVGAHGLDAGGHTHDDEHYIVTGKLAPTGSILDRLIITSLDSVLNIHGQQGVEHHHHDDHDHSHEHDHHHDHDYDHDHHVAEPEITALLITTRTPIANMNLPHMINRESGLQAANPALEMARLTAMLGLGSQSFQALSALLILIAALSIFAGLASNLENRMGDLAILRAIGFSKLRLFRMITAEGMIIVTSGIVLGVMFGLVGFAAMVNMIAPLKSSGAAAQFTLEFFPVIALVFVVGVVASLWPAWRASRINVIQQLSRNI